MSPNACYLFEWRKTAKRWLYTQLHVVGKRFLPAELSMAGGADRRALHRLSQTQSADRRPVLSRLQYQSQCVVMRKPAQVAVLVPVRGDVAAEHAGRRYPVPARGADLTCAGRRYQHQCAAQI